ncbi:class I SAM-dependent methyltransferase [Nonomuraea sp. NN258]|uniref:class I SAM-dependent methyltransferase n=1 Tax=Nonomuraea antri TaxID=2730852 RepID=UPI0015687306|nr:class I SAM-dependent methyltransferase [Nonomuraea antri]NRQ37052.1 class I SAM-dependent methyltransferase [Nonomuraea antri]
MPFDHNDHYHRTLLRLVPPGGRTALDVGCGTGRFARRLAGLGLRVDAVDPSAEVIAAARAATPGGGPRFQVADVTRLDLPAGHYDFVSCLASLHHMPFETVTALRATLAPGGVLAVLGCYAERFPADLPWSLTAVAANAGARLSVAAWERVTGAAGPPPTQAPAQAPTQGSTRAPTRAPVAAPEMSLAEIRSRAAALLPGCTIRRLLFWRYLLVFRA